MGRDPVKRRSVWSIEIPWRVSLSSTVARAKMDLSLQFFLLLRYLLKPEQYVRLRPQAHGSVLPATFGGIHWRSAQHVS